MNLYKKFLFLLIFQLLLFSFYSNAQIGGNNTYEFLNLSVSARSAALGGNLISVKDDDINLTFHNPSLLSKEMNNNLALTYINYFGDINYGYAVYSRSYDKIGSFMSGLQFVNYGKFTQADATGQITGEFKAGEYALNTGFGRQLDSMFSIGVNLKTIYSSLEQYNSFGSALDFAATYNNTKQAFTFAAVIRNVGVQWKSYRKDNREPLPFEIQCGFSKKPKHVPFRFSMVFQHLQKWDLTYEDPNNPSVKTDPFTGEELKQNKIAVFGDKLMRHVVLGGEFLLTKNFNIRLGYNYQRRKELSVETKPGMIGFSFGFGVKISKFNLSYGLAKYHLAGASNLFSITTNLNDFYSKGNRQ